MPIATGVAWFHDCAGGEFVHYPNGPDAPAAAHQVRNDSALVLDTDSVFHGVGRVGGPDAGVAPLRPGMSLDFAGDDTWVVHDGDSTVATYRWDELRFSVSWKAYCFESTEERDAWRAHADDLTIDVVLDRLVADLRARGRIGDTVPADEELAKVLVDEYIRFPPG